MSDSEYAGWGKQTILNIKKLIPQFSRLEAVGIAGQDDFGLNKSHHLIVSEKVKQILDRRGLAQCDFSEV